MAQSQRIQHEPVSQPGTLHTTSHYTLNQPTCLSNTLVTRSPHSNGFVGGIPVSTRKAIKSLKSLFIEYLNESSDLVIIEHSDVLSSLYIFIAPLTTPATEIV